MRLSDPPAAEPLVVRWLGISRQLRKRLGERYAHSGLSESRAAVLSQLARCAAAPSQAQIADELGVSPSSLCELIERLRADGLLRCDRSPLDRRQSVLLLTDTGRAACDVIRSIQASVEADVRERLSSGLLESLPALLDGLQSVWSEVALNQCAGEVASC